MGNPILSLIDQFTERTGRAIAWLNLAMVFAMCGVVVMRYLFNNNLVALQEVVIYLHGTVFLVGSAYTLKHGDHVRVDIFYQRFSPRGRAFVDFFGTLFLLIPVTAYIGWVSWPYVASSWAIGEHSQEAAGLPFLFLLKSLILVMVALLLLQGVAELIRNFCLMRGLVVEQGVVEQDNDQHGAL